MEVEKRDDARRDAVWILGCIELIVRQLPRGCGDDQERTMIAAEKLLMDAAEELAQFIRQRDGVA